MDNRRTINRFLGNRGLATLDNPAGLCMQIGFLVEDEEHFMQLLNRCEPQHRTEMYESLKPHLRFQPRPLDVLIAELGMQAEIEKLPTVDADGKFHAYRTPEIQTTVERVVEEEISQHHLTLTCRKCTKQAAFHGGRRIDAIWKAREAGWTYDSANGGSEICPDCPASRN